MPVQDKLAEIVEKYPNVELDQACWSGIGNGWLSIYEEMVKKLSALPGPPIEIVQVKEKFGILRVYVEVDNSIRAVPDEAHQIIIQAEENSRKVCENCGSPGKIRDSYSDNSERFWIRTLCEACNIPPRKV